MRLPEISKTIQVPDNVDVTMDGKKISFKGEKGSLTRDFSFAPISIEGEGKKIRVWAKWPRKKEAALVGTIHSHIQNMITGVTKGYSVQAENRFLTLSDLSESSRQRNSDRKLHRRTKRTQG